MLLILVINLDRQEGLAIALDQPSHFQPDAGWQILESSPARQR
jgi:hypothetical protein